ncbi:hypothetical protein CSB11_02885 [Candidatus Campbellbacteria bacterium]|nr:MAG: hypothetical protein CSB11_02885 [Candidatus Campbellbacteria bacterium]
MKKLNKMKLVGAVLVLGFGFNSYAEREVKNYYVNGVGSGKDQTKIDAVLSADKLRDAAFDNIGVNVGVLMNNSQGKILDGVEAVMQATNIDHLYRLLTDLSNVSSDAYGKVSEVMNSYRGELEQKIILKTAKLIEFSDKTKKEGILNLLRNPFNSENREKLLKLGYDSAEITVMEATAGIVGAVEKISGAISSVLETDGYYGTLAYEDKQVMKSKIQRQLDLGNKVNLVAHSQGNLFANQVLYDYFPNREDDIKLLSVSTPDYRIFGGGKYITLYEDLISYLFMFGALKNKTNYNFQVGDSYFEINRFFIYNKYYPRYMASLNRGKYGDFTGHGFISTYLSSGSQSEGFIVEHANRNYTNLSNSFPKPEVDYSYDKDISLGQSVSGKFLSVEESKYRNGRYARTYNLYFPSCTKVQIDLTSSVDTYLYLHANNKKIGQNDNGGSGTNSRIVMDLVGGTYEIEATTRSSGKTGNFVLKAKKIGAGDCSNDWSDIYLTNTSLNRYSVVAGEELKAYVTQNYKGNVRMRDLEGYPKVGYYLSKNKYYDSSDIYLENDSSSIGSDDKYDDEREYLTIPKNTNPGSYYILFVADYLERIDETNENNNVEYERIEILSNLNSSDDIYVTDVSVDENQPEAGDRVYIRARINYSGNSSSDDLGSIYTSYYISAHYPFDSNAIYLDYDRSSIGSDDAYDDEKERVKIPRYLSSGFYIIYVVADDKNGRKKVDEIDENNNIESSVIYVH